MFAGDCKNCSKHLGEQEKFSLTNENFDGSTKDDAAI